MDLRSKDAIESSKQHDIDMSNILIAKFMELPLVPCNIGTENGAVTEGYQHPKVDVPCTADGLQYKYSWDWLMPVVKKIKTSVIDQDETDNPYNSEEWDKSTINYELLNNLTETLVEIEIKSVYKLVVEFIKNQNN